MTRSLLSVTRSIYLPYADGAIGRQAAELEKNGVKLVSTAILEAFMLSKFIPRLAKQGLIPVELFHKAAKPSLAYLGYTLSNFFTRQPNHAIHRL